MAFSITYYFPYHIYMGFSCPRGDHDFVFGIKVLDWCVERIDPRSMIAIAGPSGGGKSLLMRNIASYHLAGDSYVMYLALDDDPLSIYRSLSELVGAENMKPVMAGGKLRIIDGFSYRMAPLRPP